MHARHYYKKQALFGVAWEFDQNKIMETKVESHTLFGYGENGKLNAADFGNYHAGYTGVFAGVSQREQWTWAGLGEVAKDVGGLRIGSAFNRINQMIWNVSPNGDRVIDFRWNTKGMVDASKATRR